MPSIDQWCETTNGNKPSNQNHKWKQGPKLHIYIRNVFLFDFSNYLSKFRITKLLKCLQFRLYKFIPESILL